MSYVHFRSFVSFYSPDKTHAATAHHEDKEQGERESYMAVVPIYDRHKHSCDMHMILTSK